MGRKLTPLATTLFCAQLVFSLGCSKQTSRPNVILISLDCLNQRQLASSVGTSIAPALSELKSHSIAFSRAYTHAPWTNPSHMSIMTGLYPSQHGRNVPYGLMIDWNDFYPRVPSFQTIGDNLSRAGYDTAAFVGMGSISGIYGIRQGFQVFEEFHKNNNLSDLEVSFDKVETWLAERKQNPFFLFLHTYDLHEPRPEGLSSDGDAIRHIDQYMGRLLLQLKMQDLYDSTLIIATGDHGSNMVETQGKCCVHGAGHYEENLRVPLLLKLPHSTESSEVTTLARHIDLLPTILEAVGLSDASYDGPGQSLLPIVERGADRNRLSFSEADGRCAARSALVTDRYKYIYTPKNPIQALLQGNPRFFDEDCTESCRNLPIEELYDLSSDPHENKNLLDSDLTADQQEWLKRLRIEMATHLNMPRHYQVSVVTGPKGLLEDSELEDLKKALKTLGYIQ